MIDARLGNNNDAKKTPSTPQRPQGTMHTVTSYGTTLHTYRVNSFFKK